MADNSTKIVISAEDRTAAGIRAAQSSLSSLASSAGMVSAAFAAVGQVSLIAMAKSAIDLGDNLNKMAQKTGIAVESLSALQYAGELSDVSLEAIGTSLKKLAVNMNEVATSGKGNAADAFKAIGVAVKDANGGLRSADAVLGDVADRFANMEDGASKTALAVAIFGKAGADMIPLLNQGSKGMKDMAEEAAALGVIFSKDLTQASEQFKDNLSRLSAVAKGFGIALADSVLPLLNEMTDEMVKSAKSANELSSSFNPMTETLRAIAVLGANVMFVLRGVGTEMGGIAAQLAALSRGEFTGFSAIGKAMKEDAARARAEFDAYEARLMGAASTTRGGAGSTDSAVKKLAAPTFGDSGSKTSKAKSELQKMLEKGQQNLMDDYYKYSSEEDMQAAIIKNAELSTRAAAKQADELEKLRDKYLQLGDPLKKYRDQLAEIETLRGVPGGLADGDAEAAIAGVNKEMKEASDRMSGLKDIGKELGLSFTSAFEDAIVGGKKFSDVLKGLGDDLLRLITRKTITEPLASSVSSFDFGSLLSGLIPKYAQGTPWVPNDGLAYLHKGEQVIPAGMGGSGSNVVVNVIESPGNGGKQEQRQQGGVNVIDIFVDKIKSAIAGDITDGRGAIPAAMSSTYGLNRGAGAY